MARFGRLGKVDKIIADAKLPEEVKIETSEDVGALAKDESERDILFFSFRGSQKDRLFLTAFAEVQRTVAALGGAFVPMRPDAPRALCAEDGIFTTFCVPVNVPKGKSGLVSRADLLSILRAAEPELSRVLIAIEEGFYDVR